MNNKPTIPTRRGFHRPHVSKDPTIQDGLAWNLWVRFHGKRMWFVNLNSQLWRNRHG